jgi:hypothetical protein
VTKLKYITDVLGERWFNEKGECHRLDGPAIKWLHGSSRWLINDKLHRLDGPAIEYASGHKEWFIDGQNLTKEEFDKHPLVIFYSLCQGAL